MNVQGWAELLESYGPLWLCINGGSHAVVLNGAQGDGTPEGTKFYITDPWSGPTTTGLDGLAAMFEALHASNRATARYLAPIDGFFTNVRYARADRKQSEGGRRRPGVLVGNVVAWDTVCSSSTTIRPSVTSCVVT